MHRLLKLAALLLAAVCGHAQGTIVQNHSFEIELVEGVFAPPWAGSFSLNSGWSNAPHGRNYAHIDYISQVVPTVPGQFYRLSLWVASDLYVNPVGTLQVGWGDLNLPAYSTVSRAYNPDVNRYLQLSWERYTVPYLQASSSSTLLSFRAISGSLLLIDDIRVYTVPEPAASSLAFVGLSYLLFKQPRNPTRRALRSSRSESYCRLLPSPSPPTPCLGENSQATFSQHVDAQQFRVLTG